MDDRKIIKIPDGRNPLEVTLNSKKHSFIAGSTVTVSEAVAAIIEKAAEKKPAPEAKSPFGGDWETMKNKPFYEAVETVNEPLNITWDGNTEGLVSVDDVFFKVSDAVLTDEQIRSANATVSNGDSMSFGSIFDQLVSNGMAIEEIVATEFVIFCRKEGAVIASMTFPESGIYFGKVVDAAHIASLTTTEPVEQTKTVVHKLDPKFIPEGAGGGLKYVRISEDEEGNLAASATYEQISEWILAGIDVKCIYGTKMLNLTGSYALSDLSTYAAAAQHTFGCTLNMTHHEVNIRESNSVYYSWKNFAIESEG